MSVKIKIKFLFLADSPLMENSIKKLLSCNFIKVNSNLMIKAQLKIMSSMSLDVN